jgi:hypothetical protein
MESSEFASGISFERLPPASSVRPVPDHASKKDPESRSRRPVPNDDDKEKEADVPSKSNDEPEHQIDSLA